MAKAKKRGKGLTLIGGPIQRRMEEARVAPRPDPTSMASRRSRKGWRTRRAKAATATEHERRHVDLPGDTSGEPGFHVGSNALSRTLGGIDLRSGPKRFEGCRLAHPSVCYPAWEELDKTLTEYHGAERVRRCLKCGVVDVTYPDVGERTADEAAQAYRDRHVSEQVATRIKALEDRVAAAERQVADVVTALVESWLQVQRARQSLASPVEWVVLSVRTADALVAALTERKP